MPRPKKDSSEGEKKKKNQNNNNENKKETSITAASTRSKRAKKSANVTDEADDEERIPHCVLVTSGNIGHYFPTKQLARIASVELNQAGPYEFNVFDSVQEAFEFIGSLQNERNLTLLDSKKAEPSKKLSKKPVVTPEKKSAKKKPSTKKFQPPISRNSITTSKKTGNAKGSFSPPIAKFKGGTKAFNDFMNKNPALRDQIKKVAIILTKTWQELVLHSSSLTHFCEKKDAKKSFHIS